MHQPVVVYNCSDGDDHRRLPHRVVEVDPMDQMARRVRGALVICAGKIPNIPGHGDSRLSSLRKGGALAVTLLVSAASSSEPPNERGVGVPSSRSLATASREAKSVYGGCLRMGMAPSTILASLRRWMRVRSRVSRIRSKR